MSLANLWVLYLAGALFYHAIMRVVLTEQQMWEWATSEKNARKWYAFFLVIWPISLVLMGISALKAKK